MGRYDRQERYLVNQLRVPVTYEVLHAALPVCFLLLKLLNKRGDAFY